MLSEQLMVTYDEGYAYILIFSFVTQNKVEFSECSIITMYEAKSIL